MDYASSTKHKIKGKSIQKKLSLAVLLIIVLALAGVFAYLTAHDMATNKFTLSNTLHIRVLESNWVPEDAKNIKPGETVPKNPQIENKTGTEAYLFAQVVIPRKSVIVADKNGVPASNATRTQMFTMNGGVGWTQMGEPVVKNDSITYLYKYDTTVGNGTTTALFDSVTYANVIDNQVNGAECLMDIVVTGYGIQSKGFESADEAWTAYTAAEGVPIALLVEASDNAIVPSTDYDLYDMTPSHAPASVMKSTKAVNI